VVACAEMLKRFFRVLCLIALPAGCAPTAYSNGQPTADPTRQKAAADRASCRGELRQLQLSGASQVIVAQKFGQCNDIVANDLKGDSERQLRQQSGIAADTLQTDMAAMDNLKNGRVEEAIALYKQIDANGPAIINEVRERAPPGSRASMQNSPAANILIINMDALLLELAKAQRMVGQYYEDEGQDSIAASWYQKANATMAVYGGKDMMASDLLGFMYAWGRGVPQDRDHAMTLFGGADPTFLGGKGNKENAFAYLLRTNNLPRRLKDVTPELVSKVQDTEIAGRLMGIAIMMAAFSGNGHSSGYTPRQNDGLACALAGPRNWGVIYSLGGSCF
jgi:TPR repeat protein